MFLAVFSYIPRAFPSKCHASLGLLPPNAQSRSCYTPQEPSNIYKTSSTCVHSFQGKWNIFLKDTFNKSKCQIDEECFHLTYTCTSLNTLPTPTPTHPTSHTHTLLHPHTKIISHFPPCSLLFIASFVFHSGESRHKFNSLCPSHEKVSRDACISCESHAGHEQVLWCFLDGQSEE